MPLGIAIRRTDSTNARFRPILSPIKPKMIPPIGLIKKPAANAPNEAIKETVGSSDGKKSLPMIGAKNP